MSRRRHLGWMKRWVLTLTVAGASLSRPFSTQAQSIGAPVASEFLLQVFQRDEGLPHNSVSAIVEAADGYLWVGTHDGLARYDGSKFVIFRAKDTPGLASDHVDSLTADAQGRVWVGLERGGVTRRQGDAFEELAPLGAYTKRIDTLTLDYPNVLWVGLTDGQLLKWKQGQWKTMSEGAAQLTRSRVFTQLDAHGRLWFASDDALGYFENDRCVPIVTNQMDYFRIARCDEGGLWLSRKGQLQKLVLDPLSNQVQMTEVASIESLGDSGIESLYEDSSGALWLGTRGNGLYRFGDGTLTRIPTSHNFILAICEDQEGDIWVGTWGGGLNRLRPKFTRVHSTENGLPNSLLLSLCEDDKGSVWIAARGAPPVSIPTDRGRAVSRRAGWGSAPANVLCSDRAGGVWIAAEQRGLFHWKDGVYSLVGLEGKFLFSLCQDSRTNLWIGTLGAGLLEWSPGRHPQKRGSDAMRDITAITEDSAGTLWVGTHQGTLHRLSVGETNFTHFDASDGLPWQKAQVIYADGPDSLWIGTLRGGIVRYRNGQFRTITDAQGLPDNDVRQIIGDDEDGLWIGTGSGLFRARRQDLDAAATDPRLTVECVLLGKSYGLDNFEFQEGFRNASCRTRDGHLWFASTRGAVEVNPARGIFHQIPPPVHIEGISVDGKRVPIGDDKPVEIPPGAGRVEIHFTAISFSAPENVRFRHRLETLDADWSEMDDRRSATYFRMTPGDYLFHVIARGSGGRWNRVGDSIAFEVKPTLWETLWFRIAVIASSVFVVGAGVRITLVRRYRRRVRELEQAQALENERRRIARDMHDELGASLTSLALMSEQVRGSSNLDPALVPKANRISETAKELAHTLDQIVWTVNPRNDTLERLIGYLSHYAADFLAPTAIRLTQDLPNLNEDYKVSSHMRHQLFLNFKEALNNAVKHSGATEIRLRMWLEGHTLRVTIEDNGKGFVIQKEEGRGEGLTTLRERLVRVGGSCDLESEPGKGTRVTFTLPLPHEIE